MDLRNLPILNSTDEFSVMMYDYANTYFLPFICLFGIITSIINIKVLIKMKPYSNINKYLLVKSCCDLTFLITQVFVFIIRCGRLCFYSYSYGAKFYEAYIFRYFGYVIIFFSCSLDMTVSLDIIFSFKIINRCNKFKIPFKIRCLVLSIISTLICIPQYVLFKIPEAFALLYVHDSKKNFTSYQVLYQLKYRKNEELKILISILKFLRGYCLLVFFALLNLIISIKLKKHFVKKSSITIKGNISSVKNLNKKILSNENKTTLMIFVILLNYLFGNIIDSIDFSVSSILENNILVNNLVHMIGNGFLYISHGLNFFIYLYFDKKFRKYFFSLNSVEIS